MNPHRSLFSLHPLAQLAVAFAAGICAAEYLPASLVFSLVPGAVSLVLAVLFVSKKKTFVAGGLLLVALLFAGAVLAVLEKRAEQGSDIKHVLDDHEGERLKLTGVLDGPPEFARDKVYLSLRVEQVAESKASGRVWLLAPIRNGDRYDSLRLRYGARIQVTTTLDRTGNYRNPGVSTLSEYLERRDFDATGIVHGPASIVRLDDVLVFPPLALLYEWRERLQREIDSRFTAETAGVLDAALLGNHYNLSRDASESFREGGTFHVLVISGLHISFIGGLVFLMVRRLTKRRLVQFVVPSTVVWAYSLAVGAEASVVRAALMFTFAGFASLVFRQASSLNALGGAALVLLVWSPKELFDPSFQLTFLSVLAIVVIAWPLLLKSSAIGAWHPTSATPYPPACSRALRAFCELLFWSERQWQQELDRSSHHCRLFKVRLAAWLERWHLQRCLRYVFGAVVVSASVQLVLLPLMIFYFHRLSLASLVLNIVVSVLLAVLVAVALLALLVSWAPLFKLANAIDWLMVHSVDPFSKLGLASLRLPEYSGHAALLYAVYYLPLLVLVIALSHWQPLASQAERRCKLDRFVIPVATVQLVLLAVLLLHPLSSGRSNGNLRIDFLDVGQGDSALVTMPDGTTLLVDGGGRPSFAATTDTTRRIGETVVSEYLWWRGLSEIDYVMATHADADHIDGLNDVLKNFSIRAALVGRAPANDPEFDKFSKTIAETRTHLETIQAGDVIRFGDVEVSVLWPPAEGIGSDNNDSVVLRIKLGERSILLTGDIEKAAERSLIASTELKTDVVKVPHHGSKTSSTDDFVQSTKPTYAIISVGRNSMFGHPHKDVVDRWQANGATVLTTGTSGTITVTTNGYDLSLKTFIQPQKGTKGTQR
ncbi:MAG TPA: DNA internalization-related competence protein ComEC/Rec2 [Pyrinomonadaceae bacterium]|nr:DNA internalization-related competence protein ComEC/Rec2 [Pyrinomonadaceae bacterium]